MKQQKIIAMDNIMKVYGLQVFKFQPNESPAHRLPINKRGLTSLFLSAVHSILWLASSLLRCLGKLEKDIETVVIEIIWKMRT